MYQKITIAGNLGRNPEMRYMPDGTAVTNLNVACNRKGKLFGKEESRTQPKNFTIMKQSSHARVGELVTQLLVLISLLLWLVVYGRVGIESENGRFTIVVGKATIVGSDNKQLGLTSIHQVSITYSKSRSLTEFFNISTRLKR